MSVGILLILATIGLVGVYFSVMALRNYRKFRGERVIICPETKRPAAVDLDLGHVALTGLGGVPDLRLSDCSRWPEREDCGQECLRQIEQAPENCLVRNLVVKWCSGKTCAVCGHDLGSVESWGKQIALLAPDGNTREWGGVAAEQLPDLFNTHKPICWNCHIAEQFRRQNPDMVTDRASHHSAIH